MRILVIDDHPLVQEAVAQVLHRLGTPVTVETATRCDEALDAAAGGHVPDLAILDLHLPGLAGIPALRAWRTRFPDVPVVVLSGDSDRSTVLSAFDAGAAGFIPKSTVSTVMLDALRLVLDGGRYLPPELLAPTAGDAAGHGQPRRAARTPARAVSPRTLGLTDRQMQVLRLVAAGVPNKVICQRLGLAERTVKAHVSAVLRALNVGNRTQLALAAARLGLAAADGPGPR